MFKISFFSFLLQFVVLISTNAIASEHSLEALQKAAQNPIANMMSFPFQNNLNYGVGPKDKIANVLNIQPILPFDINDNWIMITRTILPLIYLNEGISGLDVLPSSINDGINFGLGDINFSLFLSPKKTHDWIWGLGASFNFPTATDKYLGSKKYSIGPTAVLMTQKSHWSIGLLLRQIWSYAGESERADVNQTLIQPFINYNMKNGWYLSTAPIMTANWSESDADQRYVIPLGLGVGKIFKMGQLPINTTLHYYNNIKSPDLGAEGTVRIQVQFMFPK